MEPQFGDDNFIFGKSDRHEVAMEIIGGGRKVEKYGLQCRKGFALPRSGYD